MFRVLLRTLGFVLTIVLSCAVLCGCIQVKDNGLLCHQAVEQLNPLLKAEATAAQAPGALQWLYNNGADMLEKPSMWIIVSVCLGLQVLMQGGVFLFSC
jgi:hypothetical protein